MTEMIARHIRIIARALAREGVRWVHCAQCWERGECNDTDIVDWDTVDPSDRRSMSSVSVAGECLINRMYELMHEMNREMRPEAIRYDSYDSHISLKIYATGQWEYWSDYQELSGPKEGTSDQGAEDLTEGAE